MTGVVMIKLVQHSCRKWYGIGPLRASRQRLPGLFASAAFGLAAACWAAVAPSAHGGTTWDGGGIDTNLTTNANWNDDSAPSFTGGTTTLTFATGGSTATVDTAANLARIILNRDAAFTVADGSGSLTLQGDTVGGVLTGITASPTTSDSSVAYTISEAIALGATQSWNVANNGTGETSLSVSGVVSGAGIGLTKIGAGTLSLSGANTFTGPLAVASGVLSIDSWNNRNANGPLGNSAANIILGSATSAGTLRYSGGNSNDPANVRGIELAAGGGVIQMAGTGRDSGYVHIAGSLITGSGQLTINSPGMTRFLLTGGNSGFSGPVRVQAGELQGNVQFSSGTYTPFGTGANGLGSAMTVDSGAILTLWGGNNITFADIALGSLAGSGTIRSEQGAYTLRVGGDNTSTAFSGVIQNHQGILALTKVGAGTLSLSGANTFTGPLAVASGVLSIDSWNNRNANGPLGNSAANIILGSATSAGTLRYTGGNNFGTTRGIDLAAGGGVIQMAGTGRDSGYVHIAGSLITGSGQLTINSPGMTRFLLTGGNSGFSGPVRVQAGELQGNVQFSSGTYTPFGTGSNGLGSAMTVDAGAILTLWGGNNITFADIALGSLAGSGTIRSEQGAYALRVGGDNTSTAFSGVIQNHQGILALTKVGAGTLSLSGANTFSGPLAVASGVLSIDSWNNRNANGPLGNSAANIILGSATSAGTLRYTGGNSYDPTNLRGIELAAGGGVIQMAGTGRDGGWVHISGTSIAGSGPLTIDSPGMTRFLIVGSSTFGGAVTVQAGELQINLSSGMNSIGGGSNGLGSALTVNAGALFTTYSNGVNATLRVGSLAGGGTVRADQTGTHTLEIGGDNTSTMFSGAITNSFNGAGTMALTKVGAGVLTLNGINSYTGATEVAAGALLVNGTLGATAVTVQSGGLLGGSGVVGGSVSVLAGGTLSPGNSPGLLTSGPLSLAGTTLMEIDGLLPRGGVGGYDATDVNGLLTYGGSMLIDFGSGVTSAFADNTVFNLFSFTSRSSSFSSISTVSDGSFYAGLTFTNSGNNDKWTATKGSQTLEFTHSTGSLVIVPEPAAIALAASGVALCFALQRKRRRGA